MKAKIVEERVTPKMKRHLAAVKAWKTIHRNEKKMTPKERDALRQWRGSLTKRKVA